MKKRFGKSSAAVKIMAIVFFVIAVFVLWVAIALTLDCTRRSSSDNAVIVEIPEGTSEQGIAKILKENNVINYELSFRLKMRSSAYRGKLNYGEFPLYEKMCIDDVIRTLAKPTAMAEGIKLTVPEGWSAEKIAKRCEELGICSSDEFLKVLKKADFSYSFIDNIPKVKGVKYKLEGYLFPSTHYFDQNTDAYGVIDTLLGEFENQYNQIKSEKPSNMSMNEVIIRASMVEREAKLESERATIAGVIQNRLDAGMLLQIDACVVYAITDGMYDAERVLYSDLKIDSPYNTYKYEGLPVGAICNPGITSIKAAMNPEKHNYLYYHTDEDEQDGSHIFSETFAEHQQ